jgi:methionyl-tRNA formyltransferase
MRVAFFGSPAFAVPSLRVLATMHDVRLVVTQPDRPAGRGQALLAPAVKQEALALGLPTFQPTTLKDGAAEVRLRGLGADAFVVVAYGRILPPALLALPRLGCWNLHASLLPRYRGAAPIQRALMNGDDVTGACVMQMEAGLDTGPVAARCETPILPTDTAASLADRLAAEGAALLAGALVEIAAGRASLEAQDHGAATLAPMLAKEDGLLDFTRPARLVSAQARGVDPWPGAWTRLDGEALKLFGVQVVPGSGEPGEVLGLAPAGLIVACGTDAVACADLQLPGRRRLPAAAVIAGRPIPPGSRLGGPPGAPIS